ncbi:putative transmembrane protein [Salmonella enterica subsp. diarizonae]|uniref:Putative transmembrane protein n=1 Tax=Salmonella diarizonae TaxID=59204 RepID=A0A379U4I1_SALDZ|nr:putative transmembrane protein [Salmonella enterica subsp. diarizonae]
MKRTVTVSLLAFPKKNTAYPHINDRYERRHRSYADPIYDEVEHELQIGWLVGVDTSRRWSSDRNPFYIDDNGDLIFTPTASSWHAWYKDEIASAYQHAIADRQGRKPAPTQRIHHDYYGPTTAPSEKTLNSKAVGRLLAASGVYNGNIEGFHETAQQLGGDAPAGYDQVMNNKGLIIAGASVAAGLTMGRLNPLSELDEISSLSKIPTFESPYVKGFTSESGTLVNAEHALSTRKTRGLCFRFNTSYRGAQSPGV